MSPVLGGVRDDTSLAERTDVLAFTGDPLTSELFLIGSPVLELTHSSTNSHVDVFVRVSQVDAEGRSTNVIEGFRRLPPRGDPAAPRLVRVEPDAIAHRFPEGSRIRVVVAGGSYPDSHLTEVPMTRARPPTGWCPPYTWYTTEPVERRDSCYPPGTGYRTSRAGHARGCAWSCTALNRATLTWV